MAYVGSLAAVMAALGVLLGAFGAHGLEAQLEALGTTETWKTASFYHLLHALGAWVLTREGDPVKRRAMGRAGLSMLVGVLLFSGSLYALALGGPRWLGPITPLGGSLFVIAWGVVAYVLWPSRSK